MISSVHQKIIFMTRSFFSNHTLQMMSIDKIVDTNDVVKSNFHPSGQVFKNIPKELRDDISHYIKENVDLDRLTHCLIVI